MKQIHVYVPTDLVLVCGGNSDVKAEPPLSLRGAALRSNHLQSSYNIITPEDFDIYHAGSIYQDWLTFEHDFAQICNGVILFCESPGSIAELGAFAAIKEIAERLLVVVWRAHYEETSFIKTGILERLKREHGEDSVLVLDPAVLQLDHKPFLRRAYTLPENFLEGYCVSAFEETFRSAVMARTKTIKARETFNPVDWWAHRVFLVLGLIRHFGALKTNELVSICQSTNFGFVLKLEDLKKFLYCSLRAGWIAERRLGAENLYFYIGKREPWSFRPIVSPTKESIKDQRIKIRELWQQYDQSRFGLISQIEASR